VKWVHIDNCQLIDESATSMRFQFFDETGGLVTEEWIPTEQVKNADEWHIGDKGTLSLTEAIAKKKELIPS
jgi:hypothetical protein